MKLEMSKQIDNVRAILVPLGFVAFLLIAIDLAYEFIENEPIIAMEGVRWAIFGLIFFALIGVLYVLSDRK